MKDINIYISTCDKTKKVLKPAIMLMEKYWPKEKNVIICGYSNYGVNLPKGYSFVSMKDEQFNIQDWAIDLYTVISKDPNDFVIFMLDDMLQLDYFNEELFNIMLEKMKIDHTIIRCDLGMDLQTMPCIEIASYKDCIIVEKSKTANYWHTTQPSIWRKDYLLYLLGTSRDPWHFETSHGIPKGKREIGTRGKYIAKSMIETAISNLHPGKFNIMGMRFEDIKWLVEKEIIDPDKMQWGMRKGPVPSFSEYGFSFTMSKLKGTKDANGFDMYNHYKNRYGDIY